MPCPPAGKEENAANNPTGPRTFVPSGPLFMSSFFFLLRAHLHVALTLALLAPPRGGVCVCAPCSHRDPVGLFFPHISVWGSSFVGCHPARIRPSVPPSSSPPPPLITRSLTHSSLTHSLTAHSHSLTHSLAHSLTHHSLHSLTHSFTSLTHSLTHSLHSLTPLTRRWAPRSLQWQAQCPEPPEGPAARVVAAGPFALCSGRRSTQSLQKGLRRAWSPLGPLRFCALVPFLFAKQCSVQRLQKGLRRAWSLLGPSLSAVAGAVPRASRRDCGARGRRWAPCSSVRYCHCDLQSNAVSRDCRRACGARGRCWAPRSLQWQAQYPEPPEGTAARVVAAGPPAVLCVTAIGICKAMQCPETAEGPAARVVAAGPPAVLCVTAIAICKAMQCPETAEGPAARVVAAGPLAPAVAGAVPRASRRDCGARGRRWAPCGSVRYCHWDLQSNAVSRDGRRACGARGRRWAPRSLQWQAQYPEPPEGTAAQYPEPPEGPPARVVAAGPPAYLCVIAIVHSLRLSPQCPETAEGPAARVVAAGPPALCRGRRSTQSL